MKQPKYVWVLIENNYQGYAQRKMPLGCFGSVKRAMEHVYNMISFGKSVTVTKQGMLCDKITRENDEFLLFKSYIGTGINLPKSIYVVTDYRNIVSTTLKLSEAFKWFNVVNKFSNAKTYVDFCPGKYWTFGQTKPRSLNYYQFSVQKMEVYK